MKVRTLQDYQDKDYSLTREERAKLVVIPIEHLETMMKALRFQKNWASNRVVQARLKRKEVNAEISKMEQEHDLLEDLLEHYDVFDDELDEEEETNEVIS